jgi:hypothetical protein
MTGFYVYFFGGVMSHKDQIKDSLQQAMRKRRSVHEERMINLFEDEIDAADMQPIPSIPEFLDRLNRGADGMP